MEVLRKRLENLMKRKGKQRQKRFKNLEQKQDDKIGKGIVYKNRKGKRKEWKYKRKKMGQKLKQNE